MTLPISDEELYAFLERLKTLKVLSHIHLDGDEILYAETLVDMKLASKTSTRLTTFYFYGAVEHEG